MKYDPGCYFTEYPGSVGRDHFSFEAPVSSYIPFFLMPSADTGYSPYCVIDHMEYVWEVNESSQHYMSVWVVADGDNPASAGTRITNRVRLDSGAHTKGSFTMETDDNGHFPMLEAGERLVLVFETEDSVSGSSSGEDDGPYTQAAPSALAGLLVTMDRRYNR